MKSWRELGGGGSLRNYHERVRSSLLGQESRHAVMVDSPGTRRPPAFTLAGVTQLNGYKGWRFGGYPVDTSGLTVSVRL